MYWSSERFEVSDGDKWFLFSYEAKPSLRTPAKQTPTSDCFFAISYSSFHSLEESILDSSSRLPIATCSNSKNIFSIIISHVRSKPFKQLTLKSWVDPMNGHYFRNPQLHTLPRISHVFKRSTIENPVRDSDLSHLLQDISIQLVHWIGMSRVVRQNMECWRIYSYHSLVWVHVKYSLFLTCHIQRVRIRPRCFSWLIKFYCVLPDGIEPYRLLDHLCRQRSIITYTVFPLYMSE